MALRNGPWKCKGCGRIIESNERETLGGQDTATGEIMLYCERCIPREEPAPPEQADWWKR